MALQAAAASRAVLAARATSFASAELPRSLLDDAAFTAKANQRFSGSQHLAQQ